MEGDWSDRSWVVQCGGGGGGADTGVIVRRLDAGDVVSERGARRDGVDLPLESSKVFDDEGDDLCGESEGDGSVGTE